MSEYDEIRAMLLDRFTPEEIAIALNVRIADVKAAERYMVLEQDLADLLQP